MISALEILAEDQICPPAERAMSPPVTASRGSEIWRIADSLATSPPFITALIMPLMFSDVSVS